MRILLSILLTISPILGHAQLSTNNKVAAFNRTSGTYAYENYATNQNFDKNLNGVTTFGGTPSNTTSAKLIGTASLQWSTASNTDVMTIRSKAIPIGLNGQNCQAKFIYSTPSGGPVSTQEFTIQAKNSAGTAISALTNLPATFDIANTQASRTVIVFFPCPYNSVTPANSYVDLDVKHTASNTTSITFDELFVTYAVDIGSGVPNNVFSAKVSSTGVVSDVTPSGSGWIANGTGSNPSVNHVITGFNIAPNCNISIADAASAATEVRWTSSATATAIQWGSYNSVGASTAANTIIRCTRASTDFIQPAITPNQWNYGPRAYTPTFTGFGTVTNVECTEARDGVWNIIDCKFTSGTSTAVEGRVSLPGSNVSAGTSLIPSLRVVGTAARGAITSSSFYALIEPSVAYLTFSEGSGTTSGLAKANGNTLLSSGNQFSFQARVPIAGWTENQNAPQLLGSVTSNAQNALRIEYATIGGASVGTVCSGTCTTRNPSTSGIFSATRTGTGAYTVNWPNGTWQAIPQCFLKGANNSNSVTCITNSAPSSTSPGGVVCAVTGAAVTDSYFDILCMGPR